MSNQHRLSKIFIFVMVQLVLAQCAGNQKTSSVSGGGERLQASLDINTLGEGTEIKNAGLQLMDTPVGLLELRDEDQSNDSIIVIAVHGYQSKGYEWVTGLKNLTEHYGSIFFYRYDWERCPNQIANDLAAEIKTRMKSGAYQKIILFGHSYGGIVVTFTASQLGKLAAEIHVIAAPLSGFPNLLDDCKSLSYDAGDRLVYPEWSQSIHMIQHKTVHAQDGAFRELAVDPQEIDLPFYHVQVLPPTMDGHRLGHNWSVSWVLDQFVGRPHRY